MTLIPLRPLTEASVKHGFARGAFNVNAVAQAKAAIQIHEMLRSTAILRGADLASGFIGGRCDFMNAALEGKKKGAENTTGAVKKYGENSPIPTVLHLNHGRDSDSYVAAIAGGYISVMVGGSSLAFDENVELTREVMRYVYARDISAEGGLGVLTGAEDHVFLEGSTYINPLKVVESFRKTGVDALVMSYGTMHGASKGKNVKLHKEIAVAVRGYLSRESVFGVLVSHGSSTVPAYIVDEINKLGGTLIGTYEIAVSGLREAARCGINKINVDTDIRLAVTHNMKEFFAGNPEKGNSDSIKAIYELLGSKREQFDPRIFLTPIINTVMTGIIPSEDTAAITGCVERGVKEAVETLIVQFDSCGKAPLVEQVSPEEMAGCYKKIQIQ